MSPIGNRTHSVVGRKNLDVCRNFCPKNIFAFRLIRKVYNFSGLKRQFLEIALMRITPVILIVLGLWGLIAPETISTLEAREGRILAAVIILLGGLTLWRSLRRRR